MSKDRKDKIQSTLQDRVSDFLYYDRKEDEDLPRGAIQEAVLEGVITVEEMVKTFEEALREGLRAG